MKICSFFLLKPSRFVPIATATVVGFSSPTLALTGFTGLFAPSNFSFTNNNADGSVNTAGAAGGTIVLTGGNNQSTTEGTTTWINNNLISPAWVGGTVSFLWRFDSDDDRSDFDTAGYIINGIFTEIANSNGDQGTIPPPLLSLVAGQNFGFFVKTVDNTGGAGRLTVSEFDFDPTPVPLETDAVPVVVSLLFFGVGVWFKQRNAKK